jgi:hypothetical protein
MGFQYFLVQRKRPQHDFEGFLCVYAGHLSLLKKDMHLEGACFMQSLHACVGSALCDKTLI